MSKGSFNDIVQGWQQLLAGFDLNPEDFSQFETERTQLNALLADTVEANNRQSVSSFTFHQDTRDLQERLDRGGELATRLRNAVRAKYGNKGERLRQFGLNPLRRRSRPPLSPAEAAARAAQRAQAAARAAERAAARAALAAEDVTPASSTVPQPPKP